MSIKISQGKREHTVSHYLDPDWQQAKSHALASRIGIADENNLIFCHCCFHHINKTPIPLCQNTKQLQFIGFGLPLYFSFVRNCILLLLLMVCCYSIPSLHYALVHNNQFCTKGQEFTESQTISTKIKDLTQNSVVKPHGQHLVKRHFSQAAVDQKLKHSLNSTQSQKIHLSRQIQCTGWMIYLSRIQSKVTIQQQLFRFSTFFIHLIFLMFVRDKLTKMKYYFDERTLSPSDFSVFVKNIPPQVGQTQAIKDFIRLQYGIEQIRDVIILPDLKQYQKLKKKQQQLIKDLKIVCKKNQTYNSQVQQIEDLIKSNQQQIHNLIRQKKSLVLADQIEAQRALLIFETQDQKWNLINMYNRIQIKNNAWKQVDFKQASEPDQIIWQNALYNNKDKRYFKILGWFLSLLTLVLITAIFALISHFKSNLVEHKIIEYSQNKSQKQHLFRQSFFIVIGMILFVVFFNKFIMSHLFHKFTQIQKHSNTYKFQFYYCLKYCLGLFFTTALMTLLIEAFIYGNIFTHNFGVIQEQTIMFLINSLFVPFFWIINPFNLIHKCKRKKDYGSKYLTQTQANNLMADIPYDVGKRYGQVLEIMWFTFLYITIIPVGAIFSCIGLICYYWVDKYNLLRRSTIHGLVSGQLINLTLGLLQITLILRSIGQLLFDYLIRDGFSYVTLVYLSISIIYVLLPQQILISVFNQQKFLNQKMHYTQSMVFFHNTYINDHILFNTLKQDRDQIFQQKIRKKQQKNQILIRKRAMQQAARKNEQAKFSRNI